MKVIIVGGGAAGMLAAIIAARNANQVILLEQNEKLGKKIYITGKGRCNITNACNTEEMFNSIVSNKRFMYSSIYSFTNHDMIDFINELGCKTKIERGNRVFPNSDKSSDVISALSKELNRLDVDVRLNTRVEEVIAKDKQFKGVKINNRNNNQEIINGDKIIIATGGLSYPSTGSTGDGFRFAKNLGHTVTRLVPSLVPFNIKGDDYKKMQGLSLKNVVLAIKYNGKQIFSEMGEMLFTHFGISGPIVLSGGCSVLEYSDKLKRKNKEIDEDILISIDLKPALSFEQLDSRILRDFNENLNKNFSNSLDKLLPQKMIPVIIERSGIDPMKKISFVTKEERQNLVNIIKNFDFKFESFRGFNEAVITRGGINVKEINPSTMESKLIKGVYFAGEIIDVDALTGGYNLQIAWSTGYVAGSDY